MANDKDWLDVEHRQYVVTLRRCSEASFTCTAINSSVAAAKATSCNPGWEVAEVHVARTEAEADAEG
jgi:hypothetical protein